VQLTPFLSFKRNRGVGSLHLRYFNRTEVYFCIRASVANFFGKKFYGKFPEIFQKVEKYQICLKMSGMFSVFPFGNFPPATLIRAKLSFPLNSHNTSQYNDGHHKYNLTATLPLTTSRLLGKPTAGCFNCQFYTNSQIQRSYAKSSC
jgi:hypothetical protein